MLSGKLPADKLFEILIVEDNRADIVLINYILEESGYDNVKLTAKTNGLEASIRINNNEEIPDLVVLDINLPNKNGFELLAEIRRNVKYKNVPVIIFSSSCNSDDISTAIAMGVEAFITKPVDYFDYKNEVLSFMNYFK